MNKLLLHGFFIVVATGVLLHASEQDLKDGCGAHHDLSTQVTVKYIGPWFPAYMVAAGWHEGDRKPVSEDSSWQKEREQFADFVTQMLVEQAEKENQVALPETRTVQQKRVHESSAWKY